MLTLEQCIRAGRVLNFIIAESDIEVLNNLNQNYSKELWLVYSSTLGNIVPLKELIERKFNVQLQAESFLSVLNSILIQNLKGNSFYTRYVFLNSEMYLNDLQNIRKIKDILSRYQLDINFQINLYFISQIICVPRELERLGEIIYFDLPDKKKIKETSKNIVSSLKLKKDKKPSEEILNNLKGLTLFEIEQAYLQSFSMYGYIDLGFIREFKKKSIAKTDLLSLIETDITFKDIGGLDNLKKWFKKSYGGWTVEGQKYGLPLLKGLLLVGFQGAGKSLIAKALGSEWGLPVIFFDPSVIFSSHLGDSESNMRYVLRIVETMSPSILLIDEIEKGFAGMQSSSYTDGGVTSRVIGSFLIWMQECTKYVFTVATSNNIQILPPELINRFDEVFFVGTPHSFERRDIFEIHLKKLRRDPSNFDLETLAVNSKNLCGREIEQVLRESMYDAYYEKKELSTTVILEVLKKKTSTIVTMAEQLKYLYDWVGWDNKTQDGIRARYASPSETLSIEEIRQEINNLCKDIEGKKPGDLL